MCTAHVRTMSDKGDREELKVFEDVLLTVRMWPVAPTSAEITYGLRH